MSPSLTHVLDKAARGDAGVYHHQHIWAYLLQQVVSPMHFRDIVAASLQSHHPMTATLGQEHTAHLRIGPWPILIATAPKGQRVGCCVRGIKDRAIDGHEPIATKEGTKHAFGLGVQLTALVHEGLRTLADQFL